MTRMIERWFPCAEVSANSDSGWGSGKTEASLFTWFAKRPTAQAKAAVICSLLPWPDNDAEQKRLQDLVRQAMTGRYAAWDELRREIIAANGSDVSVADPFSGRGMIPLEAARLNIRAFAVDYSPVAVLASEILTSYPFYAWDKESPLRFGELPDALYETRPRLVRDVEAVFAEVGRRFKSAMLDYYPSVDNRQPWAYLWAITLPCQECGQRFPLTGSYRLRGPKQRPARGGHGAYMDPGQSFYIQADRSTGLWKTVVHEGPPKQSPTLAKSLGPDGEPVSGKSAICPFCTHPHPLAVHRRLANEGHGQDSLLVVADFGTEVSKAFREPTPEEIEATNAASLALSKELPLQPGMSAVPDEGIGPGNNNIIGPSIYGARTYGDLMCDRQTLGFVRLSRIIGQICEEMRDFHGLSNAYVRALSGYLGAVFVRRLRRSTRSTTLQVYSDGRPPGATDIFLNEGSITFSYDYLETGLAGGSGTWEELSERTLRELSDVVPIRQGSAVNVTRGSATALALRARSVAAVVTDPPYDEMIAYSDSSDLLFSWLKRALCQSHPDLWITSDPLGVQEKQDEIIVKRSRGLAKAETKDHRTRAHYDNKIALAFKEMRRVVRDDGVVTIVFGHGEPEVWQRLLGSIQQAGLVMTGSWPANTEAGGQQGKANIKTTLTMSCRPVPAGRLPGRKGAVESAIKAEIKRRYPDWERWGLAPADMLMAAAGPAMEVVGRYSEVLDSRGESVDIYTFLPLARAAVQEAMAVEIDHHPLETFDARTRFALWWVRLYGRQVQAKSELRWQTLASSMDLAEVRDLVPDADKGVRFAMANQFKAHVSSESAVIDVALALAAASEEGLAAMGEVLAASGREADDAYLWAAVQFLADRLPDSDPDAIAFSRVRRARDGIANAAELVIAGDEVRQQRQLDEDSQLRLL
ncbi:hypothetical protein [Nonomuraea sp. GTA35]|uniref:hypothetical protein n=1 Tax=Nonomuraea sp. GTA35 TaxID=1676746 RepID=UPI0035C12DD4